MTSATVANRPMRPTRSSAPSIRSKSRTEAWASTRRKIIPRWRVQYESLETSWHPQERPPATFINQNECKRIVCPAKIDLLQACDEFLLHCNGTLRSPSDGTKP